MILFTIDYACLSTFHLSDFILTLKNVVSGGIRVKLFLKWAQLAVLNFEISGAIFKS